MDHGESIGMMAGAYFVGRVELLRWINQLTSLNYTKIEQTASGVFACHVFDAIFPGNVRLEKVNFNARQQYEFVQNYKVLQAAFNRVNLQKHIPVDKLIKGKYQDNLEFIQWVKAFYDQHASEDALNYDGKARRAEVSSKTAAPIRRQTHTAPSRPALTQRDYTARSATAAARRDATSRKDVEQLQARMEELQLKKNELEQFVADGESEKEFYFNKLRAIEIIVQDLEDVLVDRDVDPDVATAIKNIQNHLYAEDDVLPSSDSANEHKGDPEEPLGDADHQ